MKVYELKTGDNFRVLGEEVARPPNVRKSEGAKSEDLGVLTFLKMDGMYAQVTSNNPEVHKRLCGDYSHGCPFFCISCGTEVEKVG
jgi:hypothetical protein